MSSRVISHTRSSDNAISQRHERGGLRSDGIDIDPHVRKRRRVPIGIAKVVEVDGHETVEALVEVVRRGKREAERASAGVFGDGGVEGGEEEGHPVSAARGVAHLCYGEREVGFEVGEPVRLSQSSTGSRYEARP